MRYSIISIILALLVLLAALTGCAKDESAPTQNPTGSKDTSSTAPTVPEKEPEAAPVSYEHCGLSFKLDADYTAKPSAEDEKVFVFENDQISGSIRFGKLSDMGNGATTSLGYAEALEAQYGADNAWIGSGTGIGYYVVSRSDSGTLVQCLYIYDEVCWLVEAEGADTSTEAMTKIVGRCGWNADKIPEI